MNSLVTGATGFIGGHLVEGLVKKGENVRCFVRKTSNTQRLKSLKVELFVGDFFNPENLKDALTGIDTVYHVAGLTKAASKRDYWRSNAEATRRLLEAATMRGNSIQRFIHISSQAAVGPSLNGNPMDENTPLNPIDVYGRSKKGAEEACLEYSERVPVTIIRPVAVYGPWDNDTFFFFQLLNQGVLPIMGSERKRVALVHVDDLVEGIFLAVGSEKAIGETYFIGNKESPSWSDLHSIAAEIAGRKVRKILLPNFILYLVAISAELLARVRRKPALLSFEKAREIAQPDWSCNVEKAERDLGYRSKKPLLQGMRETIEWYRREGWLK